MSKWKDRVERLLDAEHSRLELKYLEAQGNYRDTGYARYYNQMEKLEGELEEVDNFRNGALNTARVESEARRYRKAIFEYRDMMDSYVLDHKGVERPIEETVSAMRSKLELALANAGAKI